MSRVHKSKWCNLTINSWCTFPFSAAFSITKHGFYAAWPRFFTSTFHFRLTYGFHSTERRWISGFTTVCKWSCPRAPTHGLKTSKRGHTGSCSMVSFVIYSTEWRLTHEKRFPFCVKHKKYETTRFPLE